MKESAIGQVDRLAQVNQTIIDLWEGAYYLSQVELLILTLIIVMLLILIITLSWNLRCTIRHHIKFKQLLIIETKKFFRKKIE